MKKAIILAAGRGERLVHGFGFPKPLKRVSGTPLIVRVLRNLEKAHVKEVGIVVGYMADSIEQALERYHFNLKIRFFMNDEWQKPNGTSLLKAKEFVTGPTFVLMCDHLWSPSLLERVESFPLGEDESVLGVDFDIPRCFDLPDATKVRLEGSRILTIGKNLDRYEALDTGVFRVTPKLLEALEAVNGAEGCSLSQGVAALAEQGKMKAVDVGKAVWIDVDTPEAHAHAERVLRVHGDSLEPAPQPMIQPAVALAS